MLAQVKTGVNAYDVGRAAGVSRTTVSLVVNGLADKYRIPRRTQERVLAAIRQTGYTPNMAIKNMCTGNNTDLLATIARNMESTKMITALQSLLAEKGYRIVSESELRIAQQRIEDC